MLFTMISFASNAQNSPTKKSTQSRSAKTGQYVTKKYADKHPATTYTTPKKK